MKNFAEKMLLKKPRKELLRHETASQSIEGLQEFFLSEYPMRDIGWNEAEGYIQLSEEARANHIHILGTTREGKSKFLEMLIRQDIDSGYGCTLLDPSDNGDTCYNVLRYCYDQGVDKVCVIDPHDWNTSIPVINPMHYDELPDGNVEYIMESIRVLWGQDKYEVTGRIQTYLPALLTLLHRAKCTIPDAKYFSVKNVGDIDYIRDQIMDRVPSHTDARITLDEVFRAKNNIFATEFKSSVRRLDPFFKTLPRRMYGTNLESIDFTELVRNKWVVLVNLYRGKLWGEPQQRILGTLVINEIVSAFMTLERTSWKGRHYLYIDEAGQYATKVLSDIMAYKGKSGLWATISHQYYEQFDDKKVLAAIENLTKIKVMFYTPNASDRMRMVKDLYGGDLKDRDVSYLLGKLQKQHAAIKILKDDPHVTQIGTIETPEVSDEALTEYKQGLYKAQGWYHTKDVIDKELNGRFKRTDAAAKPALRRGTATDTGKRTANDKEGVSPDSKHVPSPSPNTDGVKRKSIFDNPPDSRPVLPSKKGRPASKKDSDTSPKG